MFFSALKASARRFRSIEERCKKIQEALGRIEGRQLLDLSVADIQGAEFRVFSQWGEDGILQHLLRHIIAPRKVFVEFGVENYTESNTRFLLTNDNWAGLVIDGSEKNVAYIKKDNIYWRFNLKAENAFITRENINNLIRRNGIEGEIGLLSIDIDGNDYWVWEAIDVVVPSIVVLEYNSRFGPERAVTVPYDAGFVRTMAHHSNIYYGASLAALCLLGRRKGYSFVGCNMAGNNAFFVRSELRPAALPELTSMEGFVKSQFSESRDAHGVLAFLTDAQEAAILDQCPLVEVS
ncbi:MAG: hypothetical protein ABI164_09640 [Acidobacteriaceae bacterium]